MGVADPWTDLVGRLDEKAAVSRWLGEACVGTPRIVVVSGEPGMGKTLLVRWLAEQAQRDGIRTAWAAAVEGLNVPFLAARQLLAGLSEQRVIGNSDIPDYGPWDAPSSTAIVHAVDNVVTTAIAAPLMLVLDDLQWADEGTAALVQHLAVAMGTTAVPLPLLFVVALRSGEHGGANDAGIRAGRRLTREPVARALHVGPLDEVEVREFCLRLTQRYPSRTELRDLVERTGGNPLLVRAALTSRRPEGGHTPAGEVAALDLLEGRWSVLPGDTRRAVEIVAVVGDGVPQSALAVLLGPELTRLIEPAVEAGLLTVTGGAVTFEHSLYRQAVLQQLGEDKSRAIAAQVAAQVAAEPLRSMLPASIVASQLRSSPGAVSEAVVADIRWSAGDDAFRLGAWGVAGEHYEAALVAATAAGLGWADVPERWYRASEAVFRDNDVHCVDLLRRAIELARPADNISVLAPATALLVRGRLTLGAGLQMVEEESDALALARGDDPRVDPWRATLFGVAAECRFGAFDAQAGTALAAAARTAAIASGDPTTRWAVEQSEGLTHLAALRLTQALECFDRSVDAAVAAASPWHEASSRHRAALVSLMVGDVIGADRAIEQGIAIARSCHHWAECSFGGATRSRVLALRGSPGAEAEAEAAAAMYRRTSYAFSPIVLYPGLAYSRATRGDIDGAADALDELDGTGYPSGPYRRMLQRIERLMSAEPLDGDVLVRAPRHGPFTLDTLAGLGVGSELCVEVGDSELSARYADALDAVLDSGVVLGADWPHFFPRLRAELAAIVDDPSSVAHVDRAAEIADRQGLVFESVRIALLRSRLADAPAIAVEHASAALRLADSAGLLAGVAMGRQRLRELGAASGEPIARAVLNTDIVSSTKLTRALGDEVWLEVLDEHDSLVRGIVRRNGGVIFKHTGDGIFAWFSTAADAVRAARTTLAEFEGRLLHHGRVRMQVRAGLALGSPLSRADGDLFGVTVIEAARMCAAADPARGLATRGIADNASGLLTPRGTRSLKGFDAPVEVFEVAPAR